MSTDDRHSAPVPTKAWGRSAAAYGGDSQEITPDEIPIARRVRLPNGELSNDYWAFDE
jgi:hypothetical protein